MSLRLLYSIRDKLFYDFTYILLIVEKSIKLLSSYLIIYLLKKDELIDLLSIYALIEMSSITFFTLSIFGTDIISQRELKEGDVISKINMFFSFRVVVSFFLFILSMCLFSTLVSDTFSFFEIFIIFSFLIFSPFQIFEYYLYAIKSFKRVYIYKIITFSLSLLFKILVFTYYTKFIVYTISIEYIVLFFIYFKFLKKFLILNDFYNNVSVFFKKYFKSVFLLFIASMIVVLNNQLLFVFLKHTSTAEIIAYLYIFLKFAEGFNFVSVNLGLMKIPESNNDLYFSIIFKKIKNLKYFIILSVVLFFLYYLCYIVYKLPLPKTLSLLALILTFVNTYQIFLGINFVFKKKEKLKLLMNISTLMVLIISLFITFNFKSLIIIILSLIFSKILSVFIVVKFNSNER